MSGGNGDDSYTIEDRTDLVIEAANEGINWITSLLDSYALPDNVEHLDIVDWADGVNRSGTGNDLNNQLIGSDGINRLSGLEGNDTLEGLGGNDSFYGGNGNDVLDGAVIRTAWRVEQEMIDTALIEQPIKSSKRPMLASTRSNPQSPGFWAPIWNISL